MRTPSGHLPPLLRKAAAAARRKAIGGGPRGGASTSRARARAIATATTFASARPTSAFASSRASCWANQCIVRSGCSPTRGSTRSPSARASFGCCRRS
eukprot:374486-Prymnesium_polylepis.1